MRYLIAILLLNPVLLFGQELYHVQAQSAQIFAQSGGNSAVLATLKIGDEIELIKNYASGWARVKHKQTIGFIDFNLIAAGKFGEDTKAEKAKLFHVSVFQTAIYQSKSADKVLKTLDKNTKIKLISSDGTWARVQFESFIGYINAAHIKEGEPEKEEKIEKFVPIAYLITYPNASLQKSDDKSSKVLKTYAKGDLIEVVKIQDNGWAKVKTESGFAYILTSSIKKAPKEGGNNAKGSTKNPIKVGAVCRDGTVEKGTGSGVCSKHNGVQSWIYRPAP